MCGKHRAKTVPNRLTKIPPKPDPAIEWVEIEDFFIEKALLAMRYNCDYGPCKGMCCSDGCFIGAVEKDRVTPQIKKIAVYLRDRRELPFWSDGEGQWEFTDPTPDSDGEYHTRVIGGTCVFQIPDGRCSIHAFCLDYGIPWERFKFEVCVSFPLQFPTIQWGPRV